MDTITREPAYTSGGNRHTQWALDAEWRELRTQVQCIVNAADLALNALESLPRPLLVAEAETRAAAITAFAEHLSNNLDDLLGDLLAPLHRRADAAGIDPTQYTPDRSDFDAAMAKISGRA